MRPELVVSLGDIVAIANQEPRYRTLRVEYESVNLRKKLGLSDHLGELLKLGVLGRGHGCRETALMGFHNFIKMHKRENERVV